jgi:hypothetical protein
MCHTLHYVGHWLVLDPTVNSSASAATNLAPDAQTTPVDHEHTQAVDPPPEHTIDMIRRRASSLPVWILSLVAAGQVGAHNANLLLHSHKLLSSPHVTQPAV